MLLRNRHFCHHHNLLCIMYLYFLCFFVRLSNVLQFFASAFNVYIKKR